MLYQHPIKRLINISIVLTLGSIELSAAAFSTVSPYIQVASTEINTQVTKGMTGAASQIDGIKGSVGTKIKSEYEEREKDLAIIKTLQSESLLLMKQFEKSQIDNSALRTTNNKFIGSTTQSKALSTEEMIKISPAN